MLKSKRGKWAIWGAPERSRIDRAAKRHLDPIQKVKDCNNGGPRTCLSQRVSKDWQDGNSFLRNGLRSLQLETPPNWAYKLQPRGSRNRELRRLAQE